MTVESGTGGLVALAADRDIEEALAKLFARPEALGVAPFRHEIRRHPRRDPGCRVEAADFLRPFRNRFSHALVVFDRVGCGGVGPREDIEASVERELHQSGWEDRGRAVVIDPELEVWVWSDSPAVLSALRWTQGHQALRSWLAAEQLWNPGAAKPHDPKAAMLRCLRKTRRRRSARIFGEIAAGTSLEGCRDPAFGKIRTVLREWYPARR
ncbi:methylation-associated defense system protein MAD4 [Candidatus Palauibacter sp.]|uniref:methylation-associated defense system protein MAD4 n=1 Tax=Candidatus Palauibacter sp. TaxID=3101350 RepID=UPI003B019111